MALVHPFREGEVVQANMSKGKYAEEYDERILSARVSKISVEIPNKIEKGNIYLMTKYITVKIFSFDGYDYYLRPNE